MSRDEEQIRLRCPDCRTKYRVPASKAGRTVRCSQCQTKFRIPAAKPSAKHVPTEDDIMRWLNEGSDDDYIAPRPRVAKMPVVPPTSSNDRITGEDTRAARHPDATHPAQPESRSRGVSEHRDVLNDPMIFRKTG